MTFQSKRPLGSAQARPLALLRARLAAPGGSALPGKRTALCSPPPKPPADATAFAIKVAMRALVFDCKKAEALKLMDEHDIQRTGSIGEREFIEP